MTRLHTFVVAILSASTICGATAETVSDQQGLVGGQAFYQQKAEGWFWYKDPPAEPVQEKEKPKKPAIAATTPPPKDEFKAPDPVEKPKGPKVLSVAWIRENLPKFRDRAIDNPTQENVQAYYYLQRVMMDKSSKFSEASSRVIMRDPFLDEDSRRPVATFAANAMNRAAGMKKDEVVRDISKKAGLFFFFKGNCVLCDEQASVLEALYKKSGMTVIPISLDGTALSNGMFPTYRVDEGQAKQLKIYQAPALALAIPPDKTEIVGYGAVTLDVLMNRIVTVAEDVGLIDHKTYLATQPVFDNGLLSMEDMEGFDESIVEDPAAFISRMQEALATKSMEPGQ